MMLILKVPDHQVAGHHALNGKLGPLVDEFGHFYKPLQKNGRGSTELEFYNTFLSDETIPNHIRKLFPKFYGTQLVRASDGSGPCSHLVLEDVTACYTNPSIIDVKIGSRTWYTQATQEYIEKCLKRDRETSSLALGFRISGLMFYKGQQSGYWKPDRKLTTTYTSDDISLVLRKFVSWNQSDDLEENPDCRFCSQVFGGPSGILAQLQDLKSWFEDQTKYHFHSTSILMVYDKESVEKSRVSGPSVKLVDFAHVVEGNGIIDHNFLGGLCSLIKFISDILALQNGCTNKDSLQNGG
ncbi:inositol polyphosphate multikinase beta-like [Amaranthus tricolor]|uniref:inositol polyphosphate multikinase beta-like n=1 Tax=Amaranthus tricolor TaxID=29722 RepID=UPI00258EB84B|nr:inositol polyphosphate multikinase beta-like [Amaranthus tricolor]XP_057520929.1 inositol polyphosphate multikinase beta-like [Amaranthus tricolor]